MEVTYVEAAELKEIITGGVESVLVVDVRGDDYAGGHVRGSVNVPCTENSIWAEGREEELKRWAASVISGDGTEPKTKIIFHCAESRVRGPTCARAFALAVEELKVSRPPEVQVLRGGYSQWARSFEGVADEDVLIEK